MNIFRKYTRKSLAQNRSRTLVTIIGIILSMALLTAVIEGAYSGVKFMENVEIENSGRWEIYFSDMNDAKLDKLSKDQNIKQYVSWRNLGFALAGADREDDPYYIVNSVGDDIYDVLKINMASGRLPENDQEIIIPHNGVLGHGIGDIIKLSVGSRVSASGEALRIESYQEGEKLVNTTEKSYTIVGIYNRLDRDIVPYDYPGYVAITKSTEGDVFGTFTILKNSGKAYDLLKSWSGDPEDPQYISTAKPHASLLNYRGSVRNARIQSVVYGFAAILVVMVAFGSVSLIYNSFSISLAERTKQFGILKSVGATKKQLKSSVMYEALVLGAIGIPIGLLVGCGGIGLTLYLLRDAFSAFSGAGSKVQMKMVLSPGALIISAVVCLIVIFIAAWIPAARAVRIQPIQAIRQNADTRIKAREVKTSKLTQKLFGFEGMMASKNFKRNSKRYRATVLSLFMSTVLFISASSFTSYLTGSVEGIVSQGADLDIYLEFYEKRSADSLKELVSGVSGIDKVTYHTHAQGDTVFDPEDMSSEYWKKAGEDVKKEAFEEKKLLHYTNVVFLEDAEFIRLAEEAGLRKADYFNQTAPKAVLYNKMNGNSVADGSKTWFELRPIDSSRLPITVELSTETQIEGYILAGTREVDGKIYYAYYPEDYYYAEMQKDPRNFDTDQLDISLAKLLDESQAYDKVNMEVAGEIKSVAIEMSSHDMYIVYPYSMMESVLGGTSFIRGDSRDLIFGIKAKEHDKVFSELKRIVTEERLNHTYMTDYAADRNSSRMIVTVVNVFSYGFIILISLIALANVFNTISTSIMLRRREFAMLRSIGLSKKGFSRMMNYECLIYGARSLLFGLPVALLMTYLIWKVTSQAFETSFYIPARGVIIAVASVFIVVFATMLYATKRIKSENTIDALRNENL